MTKLDEKSGAMTQPDLSKDWLFDTLNPEQFPLAKQFYKTSRYPHAIGREDKVYVLRQAAKSNKLIAAVRLVHMSDYIILRSMVVSHELRGLGLGSLLLKQLKQFLPSNCWCFPFEWLKDFYANAGFVCVDVENAPIEIKTKYLQYLSQGKKLTLMHYSQD